MALTHWGMRGTGDWVTDQRPQNWRETILYLEPNGSAPLTAILSKLKKEPTDDPQFNWWSKMTPTQNATITGVYTDAGLSSAYTSGGEAGDTLYIKMSESDVRSFRIGHQVLLRDASDLDVDVNVKVTAAVKNGASSYIKVTLLEDDDNSASHDLSDADTALIIGNINEEGSDAPTSVLYDPVKHYNYTQIFRTTLEHTGTAIKTRLRTGDQVKEAKREALLLHAIEMEKAFIFGVPTEGTGSGGKPERTTGGIKHFIDSTRKLDFLDEGKTWANGGLDWMDNVTELLFKYQGSTKIGLCGSGALVGINKIARANGTFQLSPATRAYGIRVVEWVTAFGSLDLKVHPLFSQEPTLSHTILIVDLSNIIYRYLKGRDTKYQPKLQDNGIDGEKSGFLTEAGLELHFPLTHMWLDNVGVDGA
ncbi:MAG: hypothetical protein DRP09_15030 [Candidatus Thorarchaeota archaeon]|nr:MAG: hypothetical protein DRP09_15030 [Candidatus Thorarchaeota archaeon]